MSSTEVLQWTNSDPRESLLFNYASQCQMYRFSTEPNASGNQVTTLYKTIRPNREDKVAKLEWAPNGGLGRAIISKLTVPMVDLVRKDPRYPTSRIFNGPSDGRVYTWTRDANGTDNILLDPDGVVIAAVKQTKPMRYPGLGNVYWELHLFRNAGQGVVMHPPLMDHVTVTAMLYRFVMQYNL
ncbi:hypothetical protein K488DRAFT_87966 [Vararia minispora EC-137]|uniref:Uncharacterized protein n=1 Tax=Vararia minispora EC-137 TaxID=1314806 RepID=A0ACB8QEJ1_9AGAM|nr:hypothetical protein K488DRAFT_87966 [Vararia minispora EC-137]